VTTAGIESTSMCVIDSAEYAQKFLVAELLAASLTAIQGRSKGDGGNTSNPVMAAEIDEGINGYVTLTKLSSMTMTCTRTIKRH
jgi:hypothetical protein